MELPQIDNYHSLFINDIPLIDVRAPVEYEQGAFPKAQNLPLMNNEERHLIGIRYKEQGQEQAIALGQELVTEDIKQNRVDGWSSFANQYPQGALYCFRGGLRSKISQQWLFEATGIMYPRISGGYKALRRFLINELTNSIQQLQPLILGGRTGTGKTLLINQLNQQIDLEAIFNHRGSAFGRYATPQPSQIDVENRLSIELLKHRHSEQYKLVLEDEASNIGSRQLPRELFDLMCNSPLILLEAKISERIENVFNEYVTASLKQHQLLHGSDAGFEAWQEVPLLALERIQRRLGGVRFKKLKTILQDALIVHRNTGDPDQHREWIQTLLTEYYDPMYDYQLSKKTERIIFRGNVGAILDYLKQKHAII